MLQVIRNNNPITVIVLFIYALAVNWQALFNPQLPVAQEGDFLFHIITGFLKVVLFNSAFGFTLLAVIMIALQGMFLNAIANRHKIFSRPTYVVAFVYISLCSLFTPFAYFNEALLINWVLVMMADIILQLPQSQKARKQVFNVGFAIGIAALISFPAILYLLLLLLALAMLRNLNWGEWIVAILGCLTPIYFAAGLLFLFDVLHWMPGWVHFGFNLPTSIDKPAYLIIMLIGLITLFVMGVYILQRQITRVSIFTRRSWTALAGCFLISFPVAILTNPEIKAAWLVAMPVLALIIANAYNAEKNKAFSNFAFYFTLLLVVFCRMAGG